MSTRNEEIVHDVRERASSMCPIPKVRMAAISLGYTFVELDNGLMGVCFTPRSGSHSRTHYPKAGTLSGKSVLELADLMTSSHPLEKSVGVAAVNALSRTIMERQPEHYLESDFLELLPFDGKKGGTGMVDQIGPFISLDIQV